MSHECDSKRIDRIHVYRPKFSTGRRRVRFYHVVFVVLYIYQLLWVASTIGEPYRLFLIKADKEGFDGELFLYC
jgi:hypothetical protein